MCKLCTYVFENRSAGSAKRTLPIQIRRIVVVTTIFDVRTRKGQTMALYLCLDIVNKIEYDVSEICHSYKYIMNYFICNVIFEVCLSRTYLSMDMAVRLSTLAATVTIAIKLLI